MEVTLKIEANQLGDTVLELFQNLTPDDRKSLALQVMKEWLQSPDTIESSAKETELIEGFRSGKLSPWASSYDKYDSTTSADTIKRDHNYKKLWEEFRLSKSGFARA